jgi:hypothetical protein
MSTESLLFVVMLVGPLIGAVVGFGLQLHQLRQARLNFEKAKLEIEALRERAANETMLREKLSLELEELRFRVQEKRDAVSPLIQSLSTDDVIRFADIRFSRGSTSSRPVDAPSSRSIRLGPAVLFVISVVAGLAYVVFKYVW